MEAVKRIAELVKTHNCQLHPDSIEVWNHLLFLELIFLCCCICCLYCPVYFESDS